MASNHSAINCTHTHPVNVTTLNAPMVFHLDPQVQCCVLSGPTQVQANNQSISSVNQPCSYCKINKL